MSWMTSERTVRLTGRSTLLLSTALLAGQAHALTPSEVFAKVAPSVWQIRTYDSDGLPLGLGSAVVIAPETLVTNCHVLRKASRFVVGKDNVTYGGKLEMWDPDPNRDLCQVKVRNLNAPAATIGSAESLVVGQNVYALGNPAGLELTFSAGLISSIRRDEAGKIVRIQTSAPISSGSSGGGLFDDRGRLVGITRSIVVGLDAQNLNFAVPADWLHELPQRFAVAKEKAAQTAKEKLSRIVPASQPSALAAPAGQASSLSPKP
jgi:S1-C subfamily serine protease